MRDAAGLAGAGMVLTGAMAFGLALCALAAGATAFATLACGMNGVGRLRREKEE